MKGERDIIEIIEGEARRMLPSDLILRVRTERDLDEDGDPILWVTVVVDPAFMKLDPRRTIPFGPALRFKLWDIGERAAPVLRYMVEDEDREFGPAAA